MQRLPSNECRRCGRQHDDVWQLVDPNGCWAVETVTCQCGHNWTLIHTAPVNLSRLRTWLVRGCQPAEGPLAVVHGTPWHQYRLEGVTPALISEAS
ncbi:MAG TPA: hypothetical protein VK464_00950 [Symbiobacteriaceae bacterium]|jgi:hypothetical protein|nr:hypothetical protein [Symbiobacteriaceae bacterium]